MARITALDERKGPSKKAGPTKSASVTPVVVLGLLSMLVGVAIHIKAVHMLPDQSSKQYSGMTNDHLRRLLGLSKSWPGTRVFDDYMQPAMNLFLLLIVVFKQICVDSTGRALLLIVSTCISPFASFLAIEGLKDGASAALSITALIVVTSLGQVMCIGAAMPLVMGPWYAYTRWSETKSPDTVSPRPSPSTFRVMMASTTSLIALLTFFPTTFIPITDEHWILSNVVFQFFPFAWIPLLFFTTRKAVVSKPSSAAARQQPRLSASLAYQVTGYVNIAVYYLSLYYGFKGFKAAFDRRGYWANDGHYLLFWDGIGCLTFDYIIVLLDSYVDEAKIKNGASQRTHEKRFLPEDVIMGLPGLIILGPGWAMSRYFQRREILAEKARFGIVSKED